MIDRDEIARWARTWGVPETQVVKDHLISHLLNALENVDSIVFFGGTALNRTFVTDRRISEDIDLYHTAPADIDAAFDTIRAGTRREFPDLRITPRGRDGDVHTFEAADGTSRVRIQVIGPRRELARYPTASQSVRLRFTDVPETVNLVVPTPDSFATMKVHAYEDRHAPRDLFDLDSLVAAGALTREAMSILRDVRGHGPTLAEFTDELAPSADEWAVELGHQTSDPGDRIEALERVRRALRAIPE